MSKKEKVVKIVEYQNEVQCNPKEALEIALKDTKVMDRVLILYMQDKALKYVIGKEDRNYLNKDVLWDTVQFLKFLTD